MMVTKRMIPVKPENANFKTSDLERINMPIYREITGSRYCNKINASADDYSRKRLTPPQAIKEAKDAFEANNWVDAAGVCSELIFRCEREINEKREPPEVVELAWIRLNIFSAIIWAEENDMKFSYEFLARFEGTYLNSTFKLLQQEQPQVFRQENGDYSYSVKTNDGRCGTGGRGERQCDPRIVNTGDIYTMGEENKLIFEELDRKAPGAYGRIREYSRQFDGKIMDWKQIFQIARDLYLSGRFEEAAGACEAAHTALCRETANRMARNEQADRTAPVKTMIFVLELFLKIIDSHGQPSYMGERNAPASVVPTFAGCDCRPGWVEENFGSLRGEALVGAIVGKSTKNTMEYSTREQAIRLNREAAALAKTAKSKEEYGAVLAMLARAMKLDPGNQYAEMNMMTLMYEMGLNTDFLAIARGETTPELDAFIRTLSPDMQKLIKGQGNGTGDGMPARF